MIRRGLTTFAAGAALLTAAAPAMAQSAGDENVQRRLYKIERELQAVQRKVFPGGSSEYFQPDIRAQDNGGPNAQPSASPVTDLIARVDALERQLAELTSQVEQNGYRLQQMEDRLKAFEAAPVAARSPTSAPAPTASSASSGAGAETEAVPDDSRITGVAAIERPDTGDAAEDSYVYGYRLWKEGYYPEAEAQLKKTVEDHPDHRRASFAQNLYGRALLDDGKPAAAALALHENYQKRPRSERAPDSLYYLGRALIALKENEKACLAFKELSEVYSETAEGRLSDELATARREAGCG